MLKKRSPKVVVLVMRMLSFTEPSISCNRLSTWSGLS